MFKDPQERQARVARLAEDFFAKLQRERPDLVEKLGRENILCDLRMSAAMSLPLDDESEAEMEEYRAKEMEEQERLAEDCRKMGIDPADLNYPDVVTDMILNPELYTPKDPDGIG